AKEAAKRVTPPSPPPRPRPDPREAALKARREAAAALDEARGAVLDAREAVADWNSDVVPLLSNYDGHLIAASPELVQRFRTLYHSGPPTSALPDLQARLGTFSSGSDLVSHRGELVALRGDAEQLHDQYVRLLAGAQEIVGVARARRLW